jgi:hypothetical protein
MAANEVPVDRKQRAGSWTYDWQNLTKLLGHRYGRCTEVTFHAQTRRSTGSMVEPEAGFFAHG